MTVTRPATGGRVQTLIGYENMPEGIRALSTWVPDYADLFTVESDSAIDVPPEELVRDVFSTAPAWIRKTVPFVQRTILGLDLHTPAFEPGYVIGFEIVERGDDWVRIEADSRWLGTASLVGKIDGDRISVATFVKYRSHLSAFVWRPVSRLHRLVGENLMRRAAHR